MPATSICWCRLTLLAWKGCGEIIRLKSQLEELLGETVDVVPVELLSGEVAETARREAVPL